MPGHSTMDAISALRQLCEKYSLPCEVLWWASKEKEVPAKFQQLIRAMYSDASTHVQSTAGPNECGCSNKGSIATGVKRFTQFKHSYCVFTVYQYDERVGILPIAIPFVSLSV